MKRLIVFLCSLILIFLLLGSIVIDNLCAQYIFRMTKCQKTGRRQLVYEPNSQRGRNEPNAPPGSYYVYEIEVEWEFLYSWDYLSTNIWRHSQSGAYPNGTRVAYNVEPYDYVYYLDSLYGWRYHLYYRKYDWARPGTWYYMAEYSGQGTYSELNETVP